MFKPATAQRKGELSPDWLAFGHIVIAVAFLGAWRDPVGNRWLFDFGLIACVLVIPWALVFGALRGIPWWWRLIDCSFSFHFQAALQADVFRGTADQHIERARFYNKTVGFRIPE